MTHQRSLFDLPTLTYNQYAPHRASETSAAGARHIDLRPCDIAGCEKPRGAKDRYCYMHRGRVKRTGDPFTFKRGTVDERFWAKVNKDGPVPGYALSLGNCWLWTSVLSRDGYGCFKFRHAMRPAHRYSYETVVGPIADGLQIDHLCRVKNCIRPDHLEAVTPKENGLRSLGRAAWAKRTVCLRGHPFTPENTRVKAQGGRGCKTCGRLWQLIRRGKQPPSWAVVQEWQRRVPVTAAGEALAQEVGR